MRILVCGGRDYSDKDFLEKTLERLSKKYKDLTLICGMCRGADMMAYSWAKSRDIPVEEYHADWNRYGHSAGPIRNREMIQDGKPDLVIAFPGGKGTADTVRVAKQVNIQVITCNPSTL